MPDISKQNGIDMADIAKINEQDVPSGGGGSGTATTTPTISLAASTLGSGVVTISIYSSYTNPTFIASVEAGGSTIIANSAVTKTFSSGVYSDTLSFADSSTATGTRTVKVKAQEFGDFIQSPEVTATYTKGSIQARYIRIRGVTSSGANTSSRIGPGNIEFHTGPAATGTEYPTTNLTSNTSETGIVISSGHLYSSSYASWKACDSSLTTFYWALGTNSANNWWQIEFDPTTYSTPPEIKSVVYRRHNQSTAYINISSSDTGSFSGEESDHGVYHTSSNGVIYTFG